MELDKMDLKMVTERLSELDLEVKNMTVAEDVENATEKKKALLERKVELEDLETRKQKALDITENKVEVKVIEERKELPMENKTFAIDSPEYRVAWIKNLQGKELDDLEKRVLTGTAAMPDSTANKIIDTLVDMVPLLNEIELFRVPGNISIAVQTEAPAGTREAAGGAVTSATATLRKVTLGGYNINAFIQVGADLSVMAISAFEEWLVRKLSEAIAYNIEDMIMNGDGVGDPTGIEKYAVWGTGAGNATKWAAATLATKDLDAMIALVPAAYDGESKFLMSKKTFFTHVSNVTDVNNLPVVDRVDGKFIVRGYEVMFSDKAEANSIYFGSFKRGMVGNLSSEIKVEKQRNLLYNAWDFLGWGVFDCAPAAAGCIIKSTANMGA